MSVGILVILVSFLYYTFHFSNTVKLQIHTWPWLRSQSADLTFHLELFANISANISGLDWKLHFHLCFSSLRIRGTGSCLEQSEGSDISVCLSCLSVSVHAYRPSRTVLAQPWFLQQHFQLSFYPQAMNNLWIVNQRCGVSSLDWSGALMGPRGLRWRETKPAPFHPLLVQIKIKALLKDSACVQVIWGPVEKNPGENTSLIPIHVLTGRQIKSVFLSPAHLHDLNNVTGWTRCDETEWKMSL